MPLHNALGDIQAESDTPSIVLGELNESIKDGFQHVVGNSGTGIVDTEQHLIAALLTRTITLPPAVVNLIALLSRLQST